MIPARAPAGDFPKPVIHPPSSSGYWASSPPAAQTESSEIKKNPANQIARFGAYPRSRILLAVRVQKFQVIAIINKACAQHLNTHNLPVQSTECLTLF